MAAWKPVKSGSSAEIQPVFKLRAAHTAAFERDQREQFIDRVTAHLRTEFPDAAATPIDELRTGVAAQMQRAADYGLTSELDSATYVTSAWLLGEDFDTRFPAAEAVLTSPALAPSEKCQWLEDFTCEIFRRME